MNDCPALPVAPPPVSVPLNEPPLGLSGTSERTTTGMLPSSLPPVPRCRVSASSPAWPAVTITLNVAVCPGMSVRDAGATDPAEWNRWVK